MYIGEVWKAYQVMELGHFWRVYNTLLSLLVGPPIAYAVFRLVRLGLVWKVLIVAVSISLVVGLRGLVVNVVLVLVIAIILFFGAPGTWTIGLVTLGVWGGVEYSDQAWWQNFLIFVVMGAAAFAIAFVTRLARQHVVASLKPYDRDGCGESSSSKYVMLKNALFTLGLVWMVGGVGMSIYYEIERKWDCIEQEGFLKGWLWCSSDSITPIGLSLQRTWQMVKGFAWPLALAKSAFRRDGWTVDERFARIAIEGRDESDQPLVSALMLEFVSANACRPAISLLGMKGKKLGEAMNREQSNSVLKIATSEERFQEAKAIYTSYTNGFELAIWLTDSMLSEMRQASSVQVTVDDRLPTRTFSLSNFALASEFAESACRRK